MQRLQQGNSVVEEELSVDSGCDGLNQTRFLVLFWLVLGGLLAYSAYALAERPVDVVLCGLAITLAALLPVFLWCRGYVPGLPIFPLFTLTFVWSYGAQFLFFPEQCREILSEPLMWSTTALVTGGLLLGTVCWFGIVRRVPAREDQAVLAIPDEISTPLFFSAILLQIAFTAISNAGMLSSIGDIYSVFRGIVYAVGALAVFSLGHRAGSLKLPEALRICYWLSIGTLCLVSIGTIFLINGLSILFLAVAGFSLGRNRIAWTPLVVSVAAASLLHMGKAQMRAIYWDEEEGQGNTLSFAQYPKFFGEWLHFSVLELITPKPQEEEPVSLLERASTLRLLLFAETMSGTEVPFLKGETYRIIPQMFIPRFLYPQKVGAHESTTILNVHYGFQTREATERTTIGWGLFNEAYANFGAIGSLGVMVLLGVFYANVTRWSASMPLSSYRTCLALFVMSLSIQSEFSASVYAGALFQGSVAITLFALVAMKRFPVAASDERVF